MPLIDFVIGGAQKSGTSALAEYLRAQPGIALPRGKEAHVFDDPAYESDWGQEQIDARYAGHFEPDSDARRHGDATPIYMFDPVVVRRIARYNPRMKWIVILRDPCDRAISQYHMERSRGREWLPLWAALLVEPLRLWRDRGDFSDRSSMRRHSYRARGCYRRQLSLLLENFPRDQVLVLKSTDLSAAPAACMQRVCAYLGVSLPDPGQSYPAVFQGTYPQGAGHRFVRWALRRVFRSEIAWLNSSGPDDRAP